MSLNDVIIKPIYKNYYFEWIGFRIYNSTVIFFQEREKTTFNKINYQTKNNQNSSKNNVTINNFWGYYYEKTVTDANCLHLFLFSIKTALSYLFLIASINNFL